ncbi:uncharacterized protein A4U43_C01F28660 [Asparagus officinalis]|uniref:Uncharacterized protein n=1 Tax=Asparagus officinalis TaxID=4686 RepID=A0A5P1FVC0_ASPOF|nr:uncharacterized protein A4U43_C01F28660 [Asparagus officinalis]
MSPLAQPQASSAQRPRLHRLESLSRPPPEPAPHKSQPYLTALRGSDQLPAKLPSAQGLRRFAIYTRPSALVILRPKNSKARNKNHIPPPPKILNLDPIQVNLIKRKWLTWVKDHFKEVWWWRARGSRASSARTAMSTPKREWGDGRPQRENRLNPRLEGRREGGGRNSLLIRAGGREGRERERGAGAGERGNQNENGRGRAISDFCTGERKEEFSAVIRGF